MNGIFSFKDARKTIVYIFLIIVSLILQDMIFSHISIFGTKAMFIPVVIIAIAYFEDGFYAGIMGIIAGVCADMALTASTVTCTVMLPLLGFFGGVFLQFFLNRSFFSYLILSAFAVILMALSMALPLCVFSDSSFGALMLTAAIQSVWSFVFAFPAFFACRGIARISRKDTNE